MTTADAGVIAELAVLGSVVQSLDAAREAVGEFKLRPSCFTDPARAAVFAAVASLADEPGPVIDVTTVAAELARSGMDDADRLVRALPAHAGPVAKHAPAVFAAWQRRNLSAALAVAADMTGSPNWNPDADPAQIRDMIAQAAAAPGLGRLRPHDELLRDVMGDLERGQDPSLSTGYPELDEVTGGLRPRELTVIAARAGVGKSLLGLGIADHVATALRLPVLYSSLEMDAKVLTMRRISARASVPLRKLIRYQLGEADWDRIGEAYDDMAATELLIDDSRAVTLDHMRGKLTEMTRAGKPPALHVLDYHGLVKVPSGQKRNEAMADVARSCRDVLAAEFNVPVILLAQVNRGPEQRKDRRPQLADLRETGELEQTADSVLILHRDDPAEADPERAGDIDVIVAKNRLGPQSVVTLNFLGHYGKIASYQDSWSPSSSLRRDATVTRLDTRR